MPPDTRKVEFKKKWKEEFRKACKEEFGRGYFKIFRKTWNEKFKKAWNKELNKGIKENFSMLSNKHIAEKLGVSVGTVRRKCYEENLRRCERIVWKPEEEEFLKSRYRLSGDVEIAKQLSKKFGRNFTKSMVFHKMDSLNLNRTVDEVQKIIGRHQKKVKNLNTSLGAPVGSVMIQFQKSKNRYTKWIKLEQGKKPKAYHRHVWEQAYGPIPEGFLVSFVDGDPLNCEIVNLELKSKSQLIAGNRDQKKRLETNKRKSKDNLAKSREIYMVLKKKREEHRKIDIRWKDLNSGKYLIGKLKTNEYYEVKAEMDRLKQEINNLKSEAFRIIPINSLFVNQRVVKELYNQLINV